MKQQPAIYSVRFSTRGRVTIPVALRRKYGLVGGSQLAFETTPTGFILRPVTKTKR